MMQRKHPLWLVLVGTLALSACSDLEEAVGPLSPDGHSASQIADGSTRHIYIFGSKAVPADFAARVAAAGGTLEKAFGPLGIASTLGLSGEAAAGLGAAANVAHWNEDIEVLLDEPAGFAGVEAADVGPASPSDPAAAFFYPRQWHLRAIDADRAWAAGRLGSSAVRVGILDTGIDYRHADLAGRVDLSLSRSFVPSDDPVVEANFPGAHPIADLHYHGTHVAATVASNGFAAAGVTSQVTLVGLKVLDRNGSGSTFGTLDAIVYAADIGLDVINLSLGIRDPLPKSVFDWFNEMVNRVATYAHANGVTMVVSAGNESIDLDRLGNGIKVYCTASTVACISATGPTSRASINGPWANIDAPAVYTNYGREHVLVAAPGGNTGGAVTAACSGFSLAIPICQTGTFVVGISGTSMAAPHASGVAALLVEKYGRKPGQIREALHKFADDLGEKGTDPFYGKGRINAARAVGLN